MSSIKLPFYQTIRFKLTLFYSFVLFLFSSVIVLSLNLYMNDYLQNDPSLNDRIMFIIPRPRNDLFNQLTLEDKLFIRQQRLNDLQQMQELSILLLAPIAITSFVLGYIVSGRFLEPITKLNTEIDQMTDTTIGKTIPVEIQDEVGSLVQSFNKLSLRLKDSFEAQKRFVQDASHEIKTPLTVIQTNLDTVLDDPKATKEELSTAIEQALLAVKHLRKLTDYLLTLTMPSQRSLKKVNVSKITESQIELLKSYAQEYNVRLTQDVEEDLYIKGDSYALEQAIKNVIENAIKYSSEHKDATVIIHAKQENNSVIMTIHDNGKGIPAETLPKIFERFYRVDKSRNSKTGGFGLGLAITKKIVTEHSGTIGAKSEPGNTVFTLTFPAFDEKN
ncbi:MAG: ATP-binding protein [Candidatus Dojkabacteria bacterium]|nr:MAG: ATP-binding protein [Candidatus Dojkabacteria bacterium]